MRRVLQIGGIKRSVMRRTKLSGVTKLGDTFIENKNEKPTKYLEENSVLNEKPEQSNSKSCGNSGRDRKYYEYGKQKGKKSKLVVIDTETT